MLGNMELCSRAWELRLVPVISSNFEWVSNVITCNIHIDFYEHWFYLTEIDMLNNENRADGIVDGEVSAND